MPARWMQSDGVPVSCTEKLRVLDENYHELVQVMQDAFEDAVLMDVDENAVRAMFGALVANLKSSRA